MSSLVPSDATGTGILAPQIRLSCELCTQRKKRCDKLDPCTYCRNQGTVCKPVVRARLPRGKSRPSKDVCPSNRDLRARVARLEQILQNKEENEAKELPSPRDSSKDGSAANQTASLNEPMSLSDLAPSANGSSSESARVPAVSLYSDGPSRIKDNSSAQKDNRYIGGSFWDDMMQQTNRGTTDGLSSEQSTLSLGVLSPADFNEMPCVDIQDFSSVQLRRKLSQVFLSQIDPVFKVIHQPSLKAYLLDGMPYLDYEPGHKAPETLAFAVYYAAVCVLTEEQCMSLFRQSKSSVVAKYRRVCDAALVRADFMTTNDLTVLQAFMISLLGYRLLDQGRRVWTMISMALRVGQALSLHIVNPPFVIRPLELELRRRVWHAIGLLDAQSSLDRATEPMVQPRWLEYNTPANTNDSEIDFHSDKSPLELGGFTDMTFNLVISEAQRVMRCLNFYHTMERPITDMKARQALVVDFQRAAETLVRGCNPKIDAFHWFTVKTAECLTACLQLAALRPLQRDPIFVPPQIKNHGLLKLCVDVLQRTRELSDDRRAAPWRWFQDLWAPWHPLSVAIAELCVCDDLSVLSAYWPVVEHSFRVVALSVADSKEGMLWRPIDKLMKQAQSKRAAILAREIPLQPITSVNSLLNAPNIPDPASPVSSLISHQNQSTSIHGSIPPVDNVTLMNHGPGASRDIWDVIDFGDFGDDLGGTSWSSFAGFLDDLHETDYSILTFG